MEAAVAVATLVLVLAVLLAAAGAIVTRIRCVDAAGEAARLAARGDAEAGRAAAVRLLPSGAEVSVEVAGDDVRVRVRAPPLGGALAGVHVGADAVAAREADVAGPDPGATAGTGPATADPGAAGDASAGSPP